MADVDFKTGIMSVSKSLEQTKAGLRVKSTKSEKPRRFAVPEIGSTRCASIAPYRTGIANSSEPTIRKTI
jgi:hypothetical protein